MFCVFLADDPARTNSRATADRLLRSSSTPTLLVSFSSRLYPRPCPCPPPAVPLATHFLDCPTPSTAHTPSAHTPSATFPFLLLLPPPHTSWTCSSSCRLSPSWLHHEVESEGVHRGPGGADGRFLLPSAPHPWPHEDALELAPRTLAGSGGLEPEKMPLDLTYPPFAGSRSARR